MCRRVQSVDGSSDNAGSVAVCMPAGHPCEWEFSKAGAAAVVPIGAAGGSSAICPSTGGSGGGSDVSGGGGGGGEGGGGGNGKGDEPSSAPVATSDAANFRTWARSEPPAEAGWRRWKTATFATTSRAMPIVPRATARRGIPTHAVNVAVHPCEFPRSCRRILQRQLDPLLCAPRHTAISVALPAGH